MQSFRVASITCSAWSRWWTISTLSTRQMNMSGSKRCIRSKSKALKSPCRQRNVACVFTMTWRCADAGEVAAITSRKAARRSVARRLSERSRIRPGRTSGASAYIMSPRWKTWIRSPSSRASRSTASR